MPLHFIQKSSAFMRSACVLLVAAFLLFAGSPAFAHPEDDFCGPDSGIDPALCDQLFETNNSEGSLAAMFLDEEGNRRTPLDTALTFAEIGIDHILPGGTDHILFVLALFLASRRMRSLIIQISVFTLAHTVTLGLAAAGVFNLPGHIVEPLIALSIAFVAIENIYFSEMTRWRPLIVFGFGLFHGLGFAGFISEIGLPEEQFWSSLIGFNIGVEIGQLSVVAAAALLSIPLYKLLDGTSWTYRRVVVIPCSLVVAAIGLWWGIARSLGL